MENENRKQICGTISSLHKYEDSHHHQYLMINIELKDEIITNIRIPFVSYLKIGSRITYISTEEEIKEEGYDPIIKIKTTISIKKPNGGSYTITDYDNY